MRRGQGALEYLITYGWGFIILIVVIGALAYLGFLSPTRYIPARCSFGSQLECVDYKLEGATTGNNGKVYLKFRNNFGDEINIVQIQTINEKGGSVNPVLPNTIATGNTSINLVYTIPVADNIQLSSGDRVPVQLIITFQRNVAGSPKHNITGEVFGTVQ